MLRHKIKDIPPEGLAVKAALPAALLEDALSGDDLDLAETRAEVDYLLSRSGDDVVLHGTMRCTFGLACDRCLGPALTRVTAPLTIVYQPEGALVEDESDDDDDEAAADDFGEHDRVWVDEEPYLREQIILAVPMSHLCRPDCRGLCAECGQDRNVAECGHQPGAGPASSPLAAQLADWQHKLKS